MAKLNGDELNRYYDIVSRLKTGKNISPEEYQFFISYSPKIDESSLDQMVEKGIVPSANDAEEAIRQAAMAVRTSPEYKQMSIDLAQKIQQGKAEAGINDAFNLILGGTDIANSIGQIKRSAAGLKANPKPGRPAIPQRDAMLQQALRSAQEGNFDAARGLAPAQAQIQDQYLADLQNAKTASTGQAGQFGAYAQAAANRRNRAALELVPLQDQIRQGQQSRYDNLLGMRMGETQRMFDNQNDLYGQDLNQYNTQQQAYGNLGGQGRMNLRTSLYNAAPQAANVIARNYYNSKYRNLYNQMKSYGPQSADIAVKGEKMLDGYVNGYESNLTPDDSYQYWQ